MDGEHPNSLARFKPKYLSDLRRLGRSYDGGYVVNDRAIVASKYLMSFGVGTDWSFEADFARRNPGVNVFCFDYSVSKKVFRDNALNALNEVFSIGTLLHLLFLDVKGVRRRLSDLKHWIKTYFGFASFFEEKNAHFCCKGISSEATQDFITLDDAFRIVSPGQIAENSVFLKMDVERSEFRVLPDALKFEKYINGMAIEFHELDILWSNFGEIMNALMVHFDITHIHGNNWGGLIPNSTTPTVLEITFLKKSLVHEKRSAQDGVIYPISDLDRPNNRFAPDYPLTF